MKLTTGACVCEDVLPGKRRKRLVALDQDVDVRDSYGEAIRILEVPHERVPLCFRHDLKFCKCVDVLTLKRDPVLVQEPMDRLLLRARHLRKGHCLPAE